MGSQNRVRILAELDNKVSKGLVGIRDDFDRLGKSDGAKQLLKGAGMGAGIQAWNLLGSAADKAGQFLGDSIAKASAAAETVSKSRVIFGDASVQMEAFGDRAAEAFGLSKQAAVEAGASMGNFFVGIGQGQAEAEKMSESLVGLAGDLASFNNLDPTAVLDKLRSGLTGEAEPLRSVGVFLTEAKVKAKALELGLVDAHGELTEGAKVLARYQIILDETGTAQGDFGRTADGLANSQRKLNAELDNAQARLGANLLPAAQAATQIATFAVNVLDNIVTWTREAGDAVGHAAGDFINDYRGAHTAVDTLAGKLADDTFALHNENAAMAEVGDTAAETATKVRSLADELEEHLFGAASRAGRRTELRERILDLGKQLATTTDKGDARILRGQIADLQSQLMDLDLQIAESKGPEALQATLDTWSSKFRTTDGDAYDMVQQLEALYRVAGKLPGIAISVTGGRWTNERIARASGGPVVPGGRYRVGEDGEEDLIMDPSGGGGTVIPLGPRSSSTSGSGAAGAPVQINLVVDGAVLARLVDERLYWSLQIASPARARS